MTEDEREQLEEMLRILVQIRKHSQEVQSLFQRARIMCSWAINLPGSNWSAFENGATPFIRNDYILNLMINDSRAKLKAEERDDL